MRWRATVQQLQQGTAPAADADAAEAAVITERAL